MTNGQPIVSPLRPEHLGRIAEASRRARKVRRAVGVARFSGWVMAVFAVLSLLGGVWDLSVLLLGIGLALSAFNEFRGGARLRAFDPTGARVLAWNQLLVALVIGGYCGWALWSSLRGPSELSAQLAAAGVSDPGIDRLARGISVMIYGSAIVLTMLYQSVMAGYYATRKRHVRGYLDTTEAWIVEVQRAAA